LIPGPLSPGAKQSGSEAAHKNESSDMSTTIYALMAFTGATYLGVMAYNKDSFDFDSISNLI
jgi:hypothetical protein